MTRGIGDPLIAAYTRMFVCRMGVDVAPTHTLYIVATIEDFLHTLTQLQVSVLGESPRITCVQESFLTLREGVDVDGLCCLKFTG